MIQINYIFKIFLDTSIKGSILIILILGFQKIFRKDFTARWSYALWVLVIVRLLTPFSPIKNVLSLYHLSLFQRRKFSIHDVLIGRLGSASENLESMGKSIPIEQFIKKALSIHLTTILSIIWIIGIIILLVIFCYILIKVNTLIKNSHKCNGNDLLSIMEDCRKILSYKKSIDLYTSLDISSPMTCGIICPKIVIPTSILSNLEEKNLEHILLHELVHIKRRDVLFSFISMFICVIHWFNPIVWYGFFRSKRDCELACDEAVLTYLTEKEYTEYGFTLIHLIEYISGKNALNPIVSYALINDRAEANKRIFQISKFTKKNKIFILISICILFLISFIGFNEPTSTRPSTIYAQDNLSNYLTATENVIRQTFGIKPRQTYAVKISNSPYFILDYNVFGDKIQFWFCPDIGYHSRKTIEITTTSYKGIRQGMSIKEVEAIVQKQFLKLKEIQKTSSTNNYIYMDNHSDIMVILDKKTNKVYSITLY